MKRSPNAHSNHPERQVVTCPLAECGKSHLPYTDLARKHRARALRSSDTVAERRSEALYIAVAGAATIREARKAAMDIWRTLHPDA